MKKSKILILALLAVCAVLALSSCKKQQPTDTQPEVVYYTVTFSTNGGSDVDSIRVLKDSLAAKPQAPEKDGYIFNYWSFEGKEWDFTSDKVTRDITLYAEWIDAATVYSYNTVEGGICITGIKRQFDTMRIPSVINGLTVVGLGDALFEDTSTDNVSSIVVADTVSSMGKNTFKNCKDVEIVIEGNIKAIGEAAFFGCNKLASVKLSEGLDSILPETFTGCSSLASVSIPKSVTVIDENAFEDCTALSYVVMHNTLTKIGDGAFIGCDSLEAVYFYGAKTEFDGIEIANGNAELKSASLYCYSEKQPTESGDFWYFDTKGKIKIW